MESARVRVFIHRLMGIRLIYGNFQAGLAPWVIDLLEASFWRRELLSPTVAFLQPQLLIKLAKE